MLGSPYTRSLYESLHEITKPVPPVATAPQTGAEDSVPENVESLNMEDTVSFDPRIARTCKKFLEKVIDYFSYFLKLPVIYSLSTVAENRCCFTK